MMCMRFAGCVLALMILWTGVLAYEVGTAPRDQAERPTISGGLGAVKSEASKEKTSKQESRDKSQTQPDAGKPREEAPPTPRVYEPYVYYPYPYYYVYPYPYPYTYAPPPLPRQTPLIYEWDREKDAILRWDEYTQRFKWEGIVPPKQYETRVFEAPPEATPSGARGAEPRRMSSLVGEVVSVKISKGESRITLRVGDKEATYNVADDALIVRRSEEGRGTEIALGEIKPGDQVKLGFGSDGAVNSIRVIHEVIAGTVVAVAKGTVLLDNGKTLKLTDDTEVLLPGRIKAKPSDLGSGDRIRAEVSPVSKQAFLVEILPAENSENASGTGQKSESAQR